MVDQLHNAMLLEPAKKVSAELRLLARSAGCELRYVQSVNGHFFLFDSAMKMYFSKRCSEQYLYLYLRLLAVAEVLR